MGLHPGMINYKLFATQPNQPAFTNMLETTEPMNDRFGDQSWNHKLYDGVDATTNSYGDTPMDLGKSGGLSSLTNFWAQWGSTMSGDSLRDYEGENFIPVPTQSIPYTINDNDGPYNIPANP